MRSIFHAAIIATAAPICAVGLFYPGMVSAQAAPTNVVAGEWIGKFGTSDWTFAFKNESGVWSGRYMSSKSNKWHELQNLRIADRSVSFSVVSTPQLQFALSVDDTNRRLAGNVTIPSGMAMPFLATRKS